MVDRDEYERWRVEAGRALRSAELQLADGLYNWTCFSAEQAAHFGMKALLHGVGAALWGHDPEQLSRKAVAQGFALRPELGDALRRLSRLYIASRYPDAHAAGDAGSHFGASDADAAMADARDVLGWIDERWQELQ